MKKFNRTEREQAFFIMEQWVEKLQKESNKNDTICRDFKQATLVGFDYLSNAYLILACEHLREMSRDIRILTSLCHKAKGERLNSAPAKDQNKTLNRFFSLKREYQLKWVAWYDERESLLLFLQRVF